MALDRETVRSRYATAAGTSRDPMTEHGGQCGAEFYEQRTADLPLSMLNTSLGCANPVALADLRPGETVLDLGSGTGVDALLSARRVAPSSIAYGLDMTDEMLQLARTNAREASVSNVRFIKGYIEDIPLGDACVDVVLSNCVINLTSDKRAAFAEMFRVLRPGGRLAIADVVAEDEGETAGREQAAAGSPCLAGAMSRSAYRVGLDETGFRDISMTDSHTVAPGFASVIIRAVKPRSSLTIRSAITGKPAPANID